MTQLTSPTVSATNKKTASAATEMTPEVAVELGSAATGSVVRCDGIIKRFGDTTALSGIDLTCEAGDLVVLVGPSGCGKTTLMRCVAGLETPTEGKISIDGQDVSTTPPQQRGVAMVFQNYALYPDKTARQNIEFPMKMAKAPKAERQARTQAVAEILQIEQLLDRKPGELSGGQKQRVGIGRALAQSPKVLLMDEPLSNLDAKLRVEMRAEIRGLQQRLGTTVIYVTHDQIEALTMADLLVVMNVGRIEQQGTPDEVFERPATAFVADFLGHMNLIQGSVVNGKIRTPDNTEFEIPSPPPEGSKVTVGIRPEEIHLRPSSPDDMTATVTVQTHELLGTELLVHARLGEQAVKIRVPRGTNLPPTTEITVSPNNIHLFDTKTGNRI